MVIRIISVQDLLKSLLKKWYWLLLALAVGAVVFNFIGFYKEKGTIEQETGSTLDRLGESLTDTERLDVQEAFELYRISNEALRELSPEFGREQDPAKKNELAESISVLLSVMKDAGSGLTGDAKAFFDKKVALYRAEAAGIIEGNNAESKLENVPFIQKKWIAIGAVTGVLFFAVIFAIRYIYEDKVHTVKELSQAGAPVLTLEKDRDPAIVTEELKLLASKKQAQSVAVLFEKEIGEETKFLELLRVSFGDTPAILDASEALEDPEALKTLSGADAVILLIREKVSKWSAVSAEIEVSARNGVGLIAVVVMK